LLPLFIADFFQQLFQGNPVAYLALFEGVGFVIAICGLGVLYWKLPQLAKSQLWNNILGHKPTFTTCYPDLSVKFRNPTLYGNGIAYDGDYQILLRDDGSGKLSVDEKNAVNSVYRIDGTNSPMFLRWSKQAYAVSPEIAAISQHGKSIKQLSELSKDDVTTLMQKMANASYDAPIKVKKQALLNALKGCKDEFIQIAPMYFTFDVDMTKIKEMLPNYLSDTNLKEHENIVKQANMGDGLSKGNLIVIVVALAGIGCLIGALNLLKQMGLF
jgi:hypothetical protein